MQQTKINSLTNIFKRQEISDEQAKRYALALFQIAKEQQLLGVVEEELRVVKEVFVYNTDLKALLKSSKLTIDKKKEILTTAFTSVNPYVLNTLMILIDRHREDEIIEVANQFLELANEEKGIADAQVISTRELSEAEREAISATFGAKVGKKSLRIENIVDSELLGGVKLRIGNRIYDGSLRGKLDRLERKLLS
jgi:F-type H+-transporting ATPase subunit delta